MSNFYSKSFTKELFQKVLEKKFNKEPIEVLDFVVSAGSQKGDNYTSEIFRVEIEFKFLQSGKIDKLSVVIKCLHDEDLIRSELSFQKEKEMYFEILPRISNLIGEKCSPDCLLVSDDPHMFILEDLKASSFNMVKRQIGMDLNHSIILMRKLGLFHAASFILAQRDPTVFRKYNTGLFLPKYIENNCLMTNFYKSCMDHFLEVARNWDEHKIIIEKLSQINKNLREHLLECVYQDSEFKVLNHGDMWTNNVMFQYDESFKDPIDISFVDFQTFIYAGLGIDYNHFFFSSPKQEVRDHHEELLFQTYYGSFCGLLRKSNYPKIPTTDAVRTEIQKYRFYGLFSAIAVLPTIALEVDDNASFDHDSLANGTEFKQKMFARPEYQETIKKILSIYERDGVFD